MSVFLAWEAVGSFEGFKSDRALFWVADASSACAESLFTVDLFAFPSVTAFWIFVVEWVARDKVA